MKPFQQTHMNRQFCGATGPTDKFKRKMAHLTLLVERIKRYDLPQLNRILGVEELESILSMPEMADRNWMEESAEEQATVLEFLNVYILVYSKVLKQLEVKNL